jgi:hypothetical protein
MLKIRACFALVLAFAIPAAAVLPGQDKTDKAKDKVVKEDATLEDYQNLGKLKDVAGKIAALDLTAGTMTLTIDWSHMEPKNGNANAVNQKAAQQQQQIQRDYTQIMQAKNPVQRQQALARLQTHLQQSGANLQNMFHVVKASKDFDLVVLDTLKVARSTPEHKFDDQGEVIKYTDDQLKKMKSADITGAYTAKPDDLKVGQGVKLYLDPPKDDKKKSDEKKSDSAASDSKDTKAKSTTQMPLSQVRMVLITDDSGVMDAESAKKKKKKDN